MHANKFILYIVLLAGLYGCATVDIGAARKVSQSGIELSNTTERSISLVRSYVDVSLDNQHLLAGLTLRTLPDQSIYQSAANRLIAREAVFQKLAKAYVAFDQLSSYGASNQMNTALNGLAEAINGYANTLPIPGKSISKDSATVGIIAGIFAKQQLSKLVISNSENIVLFLKKLIPLINQEKNIYSGIAEVHLVTQGITVVELWKLGIGAPHEIIETTLGNLGLSHDRSTFTKIYGKMSSAQRLKLETAISNVIELNVDRQIRLSINAFTYLALGLEELVVAHENMQNLESMSLDRVHRRIEDLNIIVQKLTTARKK